MTARHPPSPGRRIALGALAAACVACPLPSHAQEFPSKPVRILVGSAPGGGVDTFSRVIAQKLQEMWGQPVIVENKLGASASIAADFVAKSPPDGYTVVMGIPNSHTIGPHVLKLPYDVLKDFKPVSTVVTVPLILAVAADSPHKSVKDFVAWAKAQGTSLNYGSTGVGSSSHLTGEFFNERAGTKLQHVPYQGGAPLVTAFAGGQVHMAFVTGLDGAAMVQAGRIRYLAVASPQRTEVLPGLPAIAEDVPGFASVVWFGVLAPRGVPDDIVGKLNAAIVRAVARPDVRKLFIDRNVEPHGSTPAEFDKLIRDELETWGPVIRKADIKG